MLLKGPSTDTLLRLLSAVQLRAKVIANNVSNANTPRYKRQVVEFENLLLQELRRPQPGLRQVEPSTVVDKTATPRADGNTVSMETELGSMRENRIAYELYTSILRGQMNLVRAAIHGDQ